MCGIYGGLVKGVIDPHTKRINEAQYLLTHRGPDNNGQEIITIEDKTLFLGHTRLSIIDLSSGGHQPMRSIDNRYTIVFNGEIYNYRELRQELQLHGYKFKTNSDTEVLMTSWAYWGKECLKYFVGMFSFAIFDNYKKCLTLVRDPFGIKPLFYTQKDDEIFFASEMRAILALSKQVTKLNLQRAYDYLIHEIQDCSTDTFAENIFSLPPAHLLEIDFNKQSKIFIKRWWNPSITEASLVNFKDASDQLRELFIESVRLHLRSDVRLGVALSGGIDSSAVTCVMRYLEPNMEINTFSFVAADSKISEEPWIDIINKHVNAKPHKVTVKSSDLKNDIYDLINTQGEPFCTTSMYAQYRVFQAAKEAGITVILEGQGADELLAGYNGYQGQRMHSLYDHHRILSMFRFAHNWRKWPGRQNLSAWKPFFGQITPDKIYRFLKLILISKSMPKWINKKILRDLGIKKFPDRQTNLPNANGRRVAQVLFRDMSDDLSGHGLPALLRYGDRNAMRFSIENRVPFLTLPMAEFILSLPEEYLISQNGETKSVFRAAMRGIVPDKILNRRDKIGFETPIANWANMFSSQMYLSQRLTKSISILNKMEFNSHFQSIFNKKEAFTTQDWRLMNLKLWMQMNIDNENKA